MEAERSMAKFDPNQRHSPVLSENRKKKTSKSPRVVKKKLKYEAQPRNFFDKGNDYVEDEGSKLYSHNQTSHSFI